MANEGREARHVQFGATRAAASQVLALTVSALASTGCVPVVHNFKPITFRVVDGETGKPIPTASAAVSYERQWLILNMPRDDQSDADVEGRIVLRVNGLATQFSWHAPEYASVNATGYVPNDPSAAGLIRKSIGKDIEFLVPLYRAPPPVIALPLQPGFRGLIVVELKPTDLLSIKAGNRLFKIPVSTGGYAAIHRVPMLTRVQPLDWTMLRSDGSVADPREIPADPVQFRWVHSVSEPLARGKYVFHFFLVGEIDEAERARRLLFDVKAPGKQNFYQDSRAKQERLRDILRSAQSPVSVDEAEELMKGGSPR